MKKVVISGSAKLRCEINKWLNIFKSKNYEILDYPKEISESEFMDVYPDIHVSFFENITKTDMLFIMNEDKNQKVGYIGYETYAELLFALSQNLLYGKNIEIVLFKMPSTLIGCYEEINLWLKLGWIKLYEEEK